MAADLQHLYSHKVEELNLCVRAGGGGGGGRTHISHIYKATRES